MITDKKLQQLENDENKRNILNGMAKAFFGCAWADQVENATDDSEAPNLSGCEIMDCMPDEIDPAAIHAARTLYMDFERALKIPLTANAIWENAVRAFMTASQSEAYEMFGHYAAMQSMGSGVGLSDYDVAQAIVDDCPYCEFGSYSLEKDYYPQKEDY